MLQRKKAAQMRQELFKTTLTCLWCFIGFPNYFCILFLCFKGWKPTSWLFIQIPTNDEKTVHKCKALYKLDRCLEKIWEMTAGCGIIKLPIFWVAHCDDLLLLRPEAATVGCCRRQQHLWSHRNPYSRPEAAIFSCGLWPQDFLSHMSRQKSGLWSL